ncbi:glycogen debranching N-terminal domain-containing protein [Nocardioides coralli]|uniref:glycogen debranching N-terminal domain-containing protein n=1 Tax=Nocardioides coralli TaxID=2872154 RepID=UPI001CA462BC|nr:glycogen debranching N-terminal domain-containing protein [Nocardioides coralli]QZY29901.1 amylo-alpha-16-glucosidase [Nocardioides coralli]
MQPLLHDLASSVAAPAVLLGDRDGQVRPGGVSGWYRGDVRLLSRYELDVVGSALDLVRADVRSADRHGFSYVARSVGDPIPDPTVRLDRSRTLGADSVVDEIIVESVAQQPVELTLRLRVGSDLAAMASVKQGHGVPAVEPETTQAGVRWSAPVGDVEVVADPVPEIDAAGGLLVWRLRLAQGERQRLVVRSTSTVPALFGAGRPEPWSVSVTADDLRVARTARQSLDDLAGLLLRDGEDRFLAAGSPWFLTLFGRDSLWSARLLVPFGTDLALSTLRVLARRQGSGDDPAVEEQPGKILHEVRAAPLDLGDQHLPPLYYGTVDATPLFVCTLADAHAWGADHDQVQDLLPAARGCLEWIVANADPADGWLRYIDHTGTGLANQGWKDSHDSVQFADGRLADPPIALSEVQAYAYEAAVRGAALLEAFGEPAVPGLAEWAEARVQRFAADFTVTGTDGAHPAIALDRERRPVDSLTSNIGHLLGTGLLTSQGAERVATLLTDPRLHSGFGLRTLSAASPRFSRLSYHGGTVWPHDTAIAVRGLAAEGRHDVAGLLARGLFVAAESVDYRLPELYGGDSSADVDHPAAYPAACRPQAWSAAAPLAALVAAAGIRVDAGSATVTVPVRGSTALGAFELHGLRLGTATFDVRVSVDGTVAVDLPEGSPLVVRRS